MRPADAWLIRFFQRISGFLTPVAAAAGRFDPQHVPVADLEARLSRQWRRGVLAQQQILARFARRPALEPVGAPQPPVRQDGDLSGSEKFEFADDAVSPVVFALAA